MSISECSPSVIELLQRRYWIFDLDGTLTRPVHDFSHIRSQLGLAPGSDILATIAALPEPERAVYAARLDALELEYADMAQPADGVVELIRYLHQQGVCMGIVTRNKRDIALHSLRAIGVAEMFKADWVLGRDEAAPKPDPEGLNWLMQQWQCEAQQAVMVGDYHFDLNAGRAAGTATIHVSSLEQRWPDITDLHVDGLDGLLALLIRHAKQVD